MGGVTDRAICHSNQNQPIATYSLAEREVEHCTSTFISLFFYPAHESVSPCVFIVNWQNSFPGWIGDHGRANDCIQHRISLDKLNTLMLTLVGERLSTSRSQIPAPTCHGSRTQQPFLLGWIWHNWKCYTKYFLKPCNASPGFSVNCEMLHDRPLSQQLH